MLSRHCGSARSIVVIRAQQIEMTLFKLLNAVIAAGIDTILVGEERHSRRVEFAVGKARASMASAAIAFADEDFEPALRGNGIACSRGTIAARHRIAKFVERGAR